MGCYSSNGSTFSLFWFLQTEVLGEPPESLNLSSGASESWGDKLAIKLQFDPLCGHPGKHAGFLMGLKTLDHVDLPLLQSEITHILQNVSGTKSNFHFRFVKADKYFLRSILTDSAIAQGRLLSATKNNSNVIFSGKKLWLGSKAQALTRKQDIPRGAAFKIMVWDQGDLSLDHW